MPQQALHPNKPLKTMQVMTAAAYWVAFISFLATEHTQFRGSVAQSSQQSVSESLYSNQIAC